MVCVLCVDSDSSDWSSSDEEGEVRVPRPSAHMSLQAKWEWLTQQENTSASDHTPPRRSGPPPVAPKPKFLKNVAHGVVPMEPPVTFEEVSVCTIHSLHYCSLCLSSYLNNLLLLISISQDQHGIKTFIVSPL